MITRPLIPVSEEPDDEAMRARIVRRLARFGPGPAASFRDACALIEGEPQLASHAHLAGHLMRAVESSVRAALLPPGTRVAHGQARQPDAAAHGWIGAVLRALGRLGGDLASLVKALFLLPDRRAPQPKRHEDDAISVARARRLGVCAVLDSLGIAYDSDAGKAWLTYAGLEHARPHWQGPFAPRPVDQEFRRSFGRVVAMLDVVLERHEARYLASVDRLDALARATRPRDEHASELRQEFPQDPVTMEHFFSQLKSPAWLRPLRKEAFFAEPPAPVGNDEGPGWLPEWPALRYLARVAGQDPALAAEVAAGIPATENQLVTAGLVDLALGVPAAESVKLLPRLTSDLARSQAGRYEVVGAGRFGALVLHLAAGGIPDAALGLARVLWGFESPPAADVVPGATVGLRTRIGTSGYAESLRVCLPPLVEAAGPPVLDAMAGLLDEAITRTASPAMIESRQDLSPLWRAAVEGQPTDTDIDAKTALVSAVRDTAGQLVTDKRVDLRNALRRLGSRDWPIFRRLALHLLRQFGAGDQEEVAQRLTDPAAMRDPVCEREFLLLARDYFAALSDEDKQRVLNLIDQGPATTAWAASYAAHAGQEPRADQIDRWVAEWTRDRLGALEPSLPTQNRDAYTKLVLLVGEPAPTGTTRATLPFQRFTAGPSSTGFAGWSIESVVAFLQTRPPAAMPAATPDAKPVVIRATAATVTPPPPPGGPAMRSPAGSSVFDLAQELGSAVRGHPLSYSAAAARFCGLPEPYVAQVLSGLRAAAAGGADLDWDSMVRLCGWVSGDAAAPAGRPVAAEPDWAAGRREMIRLLLAGLDRVPPVIPIGERDPVWQIIDSSLNRNASAGDGTGDGAHAADQARASARAEALTAAIRYGMWVRRHDRAADLAEVFAVLDRHLDQAAEGSLVVRAVYGAEFHRLADLDDAWATGAASRIFPPDEAGRELWDAAWDAYLDPAVPLSPGACALLSDQYRLAVDRIGAGSGECASVRDVRLGRHLITRYLVGEINLDGGDHLIGPFYERASTGVRAQVAKFIGWNLGEPGAGLGTDPDALSRLTRLWEERLAAASPSADRDELVRFGEWFASGRFDDDWSLRQLARVITLTGDAQPDELVLRRLAEIAPDRTQLCLDIIGEWVRQLPDGAWLFTTREEYLSRILAAGLASQDSATRAVAEEIVNGAVRRGRGRVLGVTAADDV